MSSLENTYRQMVENTKKSTAESKMDPVGAHDRDIDNDGDHDKSDKYLVNRRKKISAAIRREDVEQVTELSKKTLGKYIRAAGPDRELKKIRANQIADMGHERKHAGDHETAQKHFQKAGELIGKAANRKAGINKAVDRLTKEQTMSEWPVYNRILEKSSRADRYKGATPPQPHGDNWAGKDHEFVNKHGGVGPHKPDPKFDDMEVDIHPDNGHTKNIKVAPKRHNDKTIGDKAMPKAPREAK